MQQRVCVYVCMLVYVYMCVCSLVVVDTAGGEQSCSYCTFAPSSVCMYMYMCVDLQADLYVCMRACVNVCVYTTVR